MSLKSEASLFFCEDSPFGPTWLVGLGPIVATCEVCGVTATATGCERNGPTVESLYGLPGWHLKGAIRCPLPGCAPDPSVPDNHLDEGARDDLPTPGR